MTPRPNAPAYRHRRRMNAYEQARALRACHDIRQILRTVTCSACETTAGNLAIAQEAGWSEGPLLCPSCSAISKAS